MRLCALSLRFRTRGLSAVSVSLVLIGLLGVAWAFPPVAPAATPHLPSLNRLLKRHTLQATDVSYILFHLATGRVVSAHDPDTPRIPASTTKLVTALAALEILGSDYRFGTLLLATGEVHQTTLDGDLYIVGGGDPTLSTTDLGGFVDALRAAGITQLSGLFLFDESFTAATDQIDVTQPVAAVYNPGVSALSLNYNRVELRWKGKPGTKNFRTRLRSPADGVFLPVSGISIGLLPAGHAAKTSFLLDGSQMDRWLLSRQLPARGVKELPVKHAPGRLAASLFRTYCRTRGIQLPTPQAAQAPPHARLLYTHYSKPLPKIIADVLRYSSNLSAELIGQVTARALRDLPLSLADSSALLTDWYRRRLPETDWTRFVSINHSGLSSASRHSPRQLAAAIRHGATLPVGQDNGSTFLDLLPHPAWGDDKTRLRTKVKAKSGTMSYADGLAGTLTTHTGHRLGFAILVTNFAKRSAFDVALDIGDTRTPPRARAWTERAKRFERALITLWIRSR